MRPGGGEFFVGNLQRERARGDIEGDQVAVAHQRERPADGDSGATWRMHAP